MEARKEELINQAKQRFGSDVFEDRFYYNHFGLLEKLYDLNDYMFLFKFPDIIKGISRQRSEIMEDHRGFNYKVENGREILFCDGWFIYFDGEWAEIRKPTKEDIDKEIEIEEKLIKEQEEERQKKNKSLFNWF